MRPKAYPYSFNGFELVDICTVNAWDKPLYKIITYRHKVTGELRSELVELWKLGIQNTLTGLELGRLNSTTRNIGELWEIESELQSVCAAMCVDV